MQKQVKTSDEMLHEIRSGDVVLVAGKEKAERTKMILDAVPADNDLAVYVYVELNENTDDIELLKHQTTAPHKVHELCASPEYLNSPYMWHRYDVIVLSDPKENAPFSKLLRPGGTILIFR